MNNMNDSSGAEYGVVIGIIAFVIIIVTYMLINAG